MPNDVLNFVAHGVEGGPGTLWVSRPYDWLILTIAYCYIASLQWLWIFCGARSAPLPLRWL